jgi:hypothetical protein
MHNYCAGLLVSTNLFVYLKPKRFGSWICFRPQVTVGSAEACSAGTLAGDSLNLVQRFLFQLPPLMKKSNQKITEIKI